MADIIVKNVTPKIKVILKEGLTVNNGSSEWGGITGTLSAQTDLQAALDAKATVVSLSAHTSDTNNPHSVTKAQVGLSNADNTSDANKPVSTAQQAALDLKVDKVVGKGLSTEDYTTAEKNKLAGIATGATANSSDATLLARANHTGTQTASTISDFAATVLATLLTGVAASAGTFTTTDSILTAFGKIKYLIDNIAASVRATILTGLSLADSSVVAATDSILVAVGKLQAQISLKEPTITSSSSWKKWRGDKAFRADWKDADDARYFNSWFEDFDASWSGTSGGTINGHLQGFESGTNAQLTVSASSGRTVVNYTTGTVTTGRTYLRSNLNYYIGDGTLELESQCKVNQNPTTLENSLMRFGVFDTTSIEATPVNAIYFQSVDGAAATLEWRVISYVGGVQAVNSLTGVPLVANQWYDLKIVINNAGTEALMYIDGNLVYTITAGNMPANGAYLIMQGMFKNGVGISSHSSDSDWIRYYKEFTTPRW